MNKYICVKCDFKTNNKKDFNKHLETEKHQMLNCLHNCACGKHYKYRQGLWKHKTNCDKKTSENAIKQLSDFMFDVIHDQNNNKNKKNKNNELDSMTNLKININLNENLTKDLLKKSSIITNICNNISLKTFKLNYFLNETCKDAMNITDFMESLIIQLTDLENVGKMGYVQGMSKIIVTNLKALDVHKRPVHCSDLKREVMYVKDKNKWEKDSENNKRIRNVIKHIATKNEKLLPEYKIKYPDYNNLNSTRSEQYNKIIIEAMGGNKKFDLCESKIIKQIAKASIIKKNKQNNQNNQNDD